MPRKKTIRKRTGKPVVLTGGKFNRIHAGHLWLLRRAKRMGKLVVVLANDSHNKRTYAVPAKQRKKTLEALKIADKVVVGDAGDFFFVVKKHKPDIIVLGHDQKLPFARKRLSEWEKRSSRKVRVVRFTRHGNYRSGNMK